MGGVGFLFRGRGLLLSFLRGEGGGERTMSPCLATTNAIGGGVASHRMCPLSPWGEGVEILTGA